MSDSTVYRAAVQIEVEVGRGSFSGAPPPSNENTQPPSRDVIEHLIADYLVELYGEQVKMKVECFSFVRQMTQTTRRYIDSLGNTYKDTVNSQGQLIKREIEFSDRIERWTKNNDRWIKSVVKGDVRCTESTNCQPPEPSLNLLTAATPDQDPA